MPGSSTTPGRSDLAMVRPKRVAFRTRNGVGTRGLAFAAQWLAYALPYRRFVAVLADANARLGADVDRYSFIVVDLHHLLLAGLPAHFESYHPSHAVGLSASLLVSAGRRKPVSNRITGRVSSKTSIMPSGATQRSDTKVLSSLKRNAPGRWPIERHHACPSQRVQSRFSGGPNTKLPLRKKVPARQSSGPFPCVGYRDEGNFLECYGDPSTEEVSEA